MQKTWCRRCICAGQEAQTLSRPGLISRRFDEPVPLILKWPAEAPPGLLTFIGVSEILSAAGLVLPGLTGILTWLTPLAALGLVARMVLAMLFHLRRGEYPNILFNLALLALAAYVAHGRWARVPL